MKTLENKVAVVTGAAGGIGQALVVELAKRGAQIAMCDIVDMRETKSLLAEYDVEVLDQKVDLGDRSAITRFRDAVIDHFGVVDLLINNAGIALGDRTFGEVTPEDFEKITNVNYWGVVHTTQQFYQHLCDRPDAAIANLSSSQGILAAPYLVPYCTTKFAVRGFTDSLRVEHKIRGINNVTVHTIHPGAVATDITINADYQGINSQLFHQELQNGTTPNRAANIILDGILKNKGRIFISDGWIQDLIARAIPSGIHYVISASLRLSGAQKR